MVVDLPAPFGPRSATVSPARDLQAEAVQGEVAAVAVNHLIEVDGGATRTASAGIRPGTCSGRLFPDSHLRLSRAVGSGMHATTEPGGMGRHQGRGDTVQRNTFGGAAQAQPRVDATSGGCLDTSLDCGADNHRRTLRLWNSSRS